MAQKATEEFENFDNTMRKLISVPHSEIKAKLEAEKTAKGKGRKKPKSVSTKTRPNAL
jgi:hypothetical protein